MKQNKKTKFNEIFRKIVSLVVLYFAIYKVARFFYIFKQLSVAQFSEVAKLRPHYAIKSVIHKILWQTT